MTPRTWRLDLPYAWPPLSLNDRLHWAARRRIAVKFADDVTWLAKGARLPTGLDRVGIVLHWQVRDKRRRDTDNPMASVKVAVDALTRYGLVPDDDSEHVTSGVVIAYVPARPTQLYLEITDLSEARTG